MPSAGELLRGERLKQGRTLAEIAEKTCISKRYLEAIETDSAKDLPGDFFYKAFIRQYASALGLDPEDSDRIVASAVSVPEPDPVPVLSQVYERAQTGENDRWRPSTGVAVGLLVAVLAGGSVMYAWWQRHAQAETAAEAVPDEQQRTRAPEPGPAPPAEPAKDASEPSAQSPSAQPAQPPQTSADVTAQPSASPQQAETSAASGAPSPDAQPASPVPSPGGPVLEIAATEPAWVQVSSEGKTVFIGTIDVDQARHVPIADGAILRTGNAGALDVRWKGRPVGTLGPRGQVRVIRFTSEGFEVVPLKPKTVSADTPSEP